MNKQIEEMAEDLKGSDKCKHLPKSICNQRHCSLCEAEILYELGYRKQSMCKPIELSDGCKRCQHNSVCYEIESLKCRSDFIWYRAESGCPHYKSGFTYTYKFSQEQLERIKNECLQSVEYDIKEIELGAIKRFAEKLKQQEGVPMVLVDRLVQEEEERSGNDVEKKL